MGSININYEEKTESYEMESLPEQQGCDTSEIKREIDEIWNYTVGKKNVFDKPINIYKSFFVATSSDRNPATVGLLEYSYTPTNKGIVLAEQISHKYTCQYEPMKIFVNGDDVSKKSGNNYSENGWSYDDVQAVAEVRPGDDVKIVFPACGGGDSSAYTSRLAYFILTYK